MKSEDIFEAVGKLDEELLKETEELMLKENKHINKKRIISIAVAAAACIALSVGAVGAVRSIRGNVPEAKSGGEVTVSNIDTEYSLPGTETNPDIYGYAGQDKRQEEGGITVETPSDTPSGGTLSETTGKEDSYGGESEDGGQSTGEIPPAVGDICRYIPPKVKGKGFTEAEIKDVITRENPTIAFSIGSDFEVSEKGYSHFNLDEHWMSTVDRDFLTLPVYSGGKIVGDITLFRVEGDDEVHSSFAYGGGGWDKLNSIIDDHKGAELVFGYYENRYEIIIAPDGTGYTLLGNEKTFARDAKDYETFKTPYNTFVF